MAEWTFSAINSIMLLSKTIMPEWGLGGSFWFESALAECESLLHPTRNTSGQLLGDECTKKEGMFPDFKHSNAGHGSTSNLIKKRKENIHRVWREEGKFSSLIYPTCVHTLKAIYLEMTWIQAQYECNFFILEKQIKHSWTNQCSPLGRNRL